MTKSHVRQTVAAGLSALLITGAATVAHAATDQSANAPPASVVAFNQKIKDGHVMVDYINLPEKGYAVVYGAQKDGTPIREALGYVELAKGDHRQVKIKLEKAPPSGSTLWVSLYKDKDAKPGLDKKGDMAIWQDRLPSENRILVE